MAEQPPTSTPSGGPPPRVSCVAPTVPAHGAGRGLFFHPATSRLGVEFSRKILHISSGTIALIYWLIASRDGMLTLLAIGVGIAVLVEVLRHAMPGFHRLFRAGVGFMVRDQEWGRVCGATYVLIAAWLSVWLFPAPIAQAVILILAFADSAASLVGLRYGRTQFLGKSLAGSLAFYFSAAIILWIALPDAHGIALLAAAVGTLAEALPALRLGRLELSDNLMIPLATGGAILGLRALGL
jgi:dolichol kinase